VQREKLITEGLEWDF